MRNKIALLMILGLISFSGFSQTRVKLNMLERSPLSNMIIYSKNDSVARYTKLVAGTGIQINYNEGDTTLSIIATGTSVGVPQTLSIDNATRELSISDGNTVDLSESIQDEVATLLQAGTNVTLTYDDVANTLTISATGTGGGASNLGDLGDVTLTSVSTGQVLKYNGAEWINAVDSGIALTDLSVTTNAAGSAALSYNNTNGVFSFTPPDLSSYLTSAQLANLTDVDTSGLSNEYILKYNSSTQEWDVKVNDIDGLSDGYRDLVANIALGLVPDSLVGQENTLINNAGFRLTTGNKNILMGSATANRLTTGSNNIVIAPSVGDWYNTTGSNNVLMGNGVNSMGSFVLDSVGSRIPNFVTLIGTSALTGDKKSTHEIAIGANVIGNGSYTATLGSDLITATYLKGTTNLRGYGLGNKEATDLSKTGSGYFLEVATDGTLIESTVTGGSAQTLSFDESTRALSISGGNSVDLSEGIQEEIAGTLVAGTGITITYDDVANTITIAAPAGSGNTDEQTLSLDNATAVLSISNGNSVDLSEAIDNQVNALLTAGDNISLTYNDVANTLTVTSSGSYTNIDDIAFNDNTASALSNVLQYNPDYETFVFGMANNTPLHIGQDMGWLVKNQTGNDIPKGTAVMAVGTVGASGKILIDELDATGETSSHYFLGVTAQTILNGEDGFVISQGKVRGINTSAFSAGAVLYANPASPGGYTTTEPTGNDLKLPLAFVVNADAVNGEIAVRALPGSSIHDLHDVDVSTLANNNILKYNSSLSVWTAQADEVNDADADPNNEIQDLSLSGNTLSLSGDASTVDLSGYLDDQTVSLTGAGITAISGTYPNFTITSTEVDGSVTNEIQDLSLSGNTLSLSGDASTVDLSGYVNNIASVSKGLTLSGGALTLGGQFATDILIQSFLPGIDFSVYADQGDITLSTGQAFINIDDSEEVMDIYANFGINLISSFDITFGDGTGENDMIFNNAGTLSLLRYGEGIKEAADLSKTASSYLAGFATDGTLLDVPNNFLQNTLSSAVTITGNTNNYIYNAINDFEVNLAGAKTLYMGHAKMYMSMDATELKLFSSETPVTIDAAIGLKLNGYGAGTKEAGDLSKTASAYIAGLATDGTVIDVTASSLQATASNGLTKTGSNIELGGTLTKATQINLPANGSLIMGDLANAPATALAVLDANNTVVTYGTAVLADYGSNNKEASDLSVTPSNYKAAFATDGTLIEVSNIDAMVVACSDETTDIATGTAKVTFRAPFAMTITGVRASLATASSSGTPTVDINEAGVSILGTKLSIDANEKTSTTAASAATITDTAIADDAEITIDIDAAGTGAKGLKVTILYRK